MHSDVFIAMYTNECKSYCDTAFYENLLKSNISGAKLSVVDNSEKTDYSDSLHKRYGDKIDVYKTTVTIKDQRTKFLSNVTASLDILRKIFLQGDWKYFIILETDVLPENPEWINLFKEVINDADLIGGLYYFGFHQAELWVGPGRLEEAGQGKSILSGCTLYKREIIEKFPFRWSYDNLGAFPDAWICYDVGQHNEKNPDNQFRMRNYTKIRCRHLEKSPGDRGHGDIK